MVNNGLIGRKNGGEIRGRIKLGTKMLREWFRDRFSTVEN